MAINLYLQPNYTGTTDRAEGGIRRVVEAMCRYLPEFGIEITDDIRRADLTNGHGVMRPLKRDTPFISSCHGLYWHGYNWANWAHQVNAEVTEALICANEITVPSRWVAQAVTRGIMRRPHVVYHGVDADEWAHNEPNEGYVLWNKARTDPVSDPEAVMKLAEAMERVNFVSTFGENRTLRHGITGASAQQYSNLKLIGALPLPEMKRVIQRAGIYLCTARETFGIGTLEALAAGVPVVGWDYGGQSEIIRQGETGLLVPYGDYSALAMAVDEVRRDRPRYSENAVEDARTNWQWRPRIEQYAQIFHAVYNEHHAPRPTVSIIVPCHNLVQFLPACLDSVLRQPFTDWECIIIDDCSTDSTTQIAHEYQRKDVRFKYLHTGSNLKLSRALTLGAQEARGKYLVNLDADNLLPEDALSDCVRELDADPSLHIVYGSLDTISHDGRNRQRNAFPGTFNWRGQIAHLNQIHSSAMMRREVAIELGGWRERQWRAEDAEFWTRATSFGFRAKRVTERPTLIYRIRGDSKGALEHRYDGGDGNWEMFFPFATASTAQDGVKAMQEKRPIARIETVPFSAQGRLEIDKRFWPVFHRQEPVVSVIIPCSFDHRRYVIDALDSLVAQDFTEWEVIVIDTANDNQAPLKAIAGAPYARIIACQGEVGQARNLGARHARGKLLYFLDADDYLLPGALRDMLEEYTKGEASYVYTDYVELWESWQIGLEYCNKNLKLNLPSIEACKDYLRKHSEQIYTGLHGEKFSLANVEANTFGRRIYLAEYSQSEQRQAITNVLIAKSDFDEVGGFDPHMTSREDWDFLCKLAVNGKCGTRLPFPGFAYRLATGTRRNIGLTQQAELSEIIKQRYDRYYRGDGVTMSKCCGGNDDAILAAKRAVALAYGDEEAVLKYTPRPENISIITSGITPLEVRLEFTGTQLGSIPFAGGNGRQYRGANNPKHKYINAHADDVERLVQTGYWRRVEKVEVLPPQVEAPPTLAELSDTPPPDSFLVPTISTEEMTQFNKQAGVSNPVSEVEAVAQAETIAVAEAKEADPPPTPLTKPKATRKKKSLWKR